MRTLLPLLVLGCAPPDEGPALVLLDGSARSAGAAVLVGDEAITSVTPVEVDPAEAPLLGGPAGDEALELAGGEIALVSARVDGRLDVGIATVGIDVDPDRVIVDGAAADVWAVAEDLGAEATAGDGGWTLAGPGVLGELARTSAEALAEVRVVAPEEDPAGGGGAEGAEATGAGARAMEVVTASGVRGHPVPGGVAGAAVEGARGAGSLVLQAGDPAALAPWVGLYASDDACLLVDPFGRWSDCVGGLDRVLGEVRLDGGTLTLLRDGRPWASLAQVDADTLEPRHARPLVRVASGWPGLGR